MNWLRRLFAPGKRPLRRQAGRSCPSLDALEDRLVPTTTVFLDFGEGFVDGRLFTTVRELAQDFFPLGEDRFLAGFQGPDISDKADDLAGSTRLTFRSLPDFLAERPNMDGPLGFDYDRDGGYTGADFEKLKQDVLTIVRRQFEPFDVDVRTAQAGSMRDVYETMAANNRARDGRNDAYVFVTAVTAQGVEGDLGAYAGLYGQASDRDLNGIAVDPIYDRNDLDETSVVFADTVLLDYPDRAATALANVASHEAGHTFGLAHALPGPSAQSEIMMEGGSKEFTKHDRIAFFSRFPMVRSDFNAILGPQNSYDWLREDDDIGLRRNYPSYVTGSGGNDIITLTAAGTDVLVDVGAFRYTVDGARGILIDAGRGDDTIVFVGDIGKDVRIRGGDGIDRVWVRNAAGSIDYRSEADTVTTLDGMLSYRGSISYGRTTIEFEEFEPEGAVIVTDSAEVRLLPARAAGGELTISEDSFEFVGSGGIRRTQLAARVASTNPSVPLLASRTERLIVNTGFRDDSTFGVGNRIVVGDVRVGEDWPIRELLLYTGRGNDDLVVDLDIPDGRPPVLERGAVTFYGGSDTDTVRIVNSHLTRARGNRLEFDGNHLELNRIEYTTLAGTDAGDTLVVGSWTQGTIFANGRGGDDEVVFDDLQTATLTRGNSIFGHQADIVSLGRAEIQLLSFREAAFADLRGRPLNLVVDHLLNGNFDQYLSAITIGGGDQKDVVFLRTRAHVFLDTAGGADDVTLDRVGAGSVIRTGAGSDAITLTPTTRDLNAVHGITIDGGGGRDALTADDREYSYTSADLREGYRIDTNGLYRPARFYDVPTDDFLDALPIALVSVDQVTLQAGSGDDLIAIDRGGVTVHGGIGDDTFHVARTANDLRSAATVTVSGGVGINTVFLHDRANPDPLLAPPEITTITDRSLTRLGSVPGVPTPVPIRIDFLNIQGMTLFAAPGINIFDVQGTPAPTTIDTAPGVNQFFVGTTANGLDLLRGRLTLEGAADSINVLTVNDAGGTPLAGFRRHELRGDDGDFELNVNFVGKIVARRLNGATLNGSTGRDFVTVVDTNVPTRIATGLGDDIVRVQGITAAATVDTGAGNDEVRLAPTAAWLPGAGILTLQGGAEVDTLVGAPSVNEFHITGNNAGTVLGSAGTISFSDFENLTGGQASDYFLFDVAGSLTGAIDGAGGVDALRGPLGIDSRVDLLGPDTGTIFWKGLTQAIPFASIGSVIGGGPNDHFIIHPGATISANLDGHNGTDTLDFSLWTSGVIIDVGTRTSPAGSFTSFERLLGSQGDDLIRGDQRPGYFNILEGGAGNDILIGGPADDFLFGGAGRDILIGGFGADRIEGGTGDDLLIGGSAQFISDDALLELIRTLWTADLPIEERVPTLNPILDEQLIRDLDADTLFGQEDFNWYRGGPGDSYD